ncbi:MAG: chromosome segregation ATPase [Kiritimatiellia bacterium]|jgi:chromosome segregation ATPase
MPYYYQANDQVMGPVDFETLYAWAKTGELAAQLPIALDEPGSEFKPAAEWPEFEFAWEVTSEKGVYGPLHVEAVIAFLEDETFAPEDEAHELETGETYAVVDLACAVLIQQNEALKEALGAASQQSAANEEHDKYAHAEIPQDRREWRDTLRQRDELAKEASKWKKFYEDLGARSERNYVQLNKQIESLKADEYEAIDRIRNLEKQRRILEERNLEIQESALSSNSSASDDALELLNLKRAYNDLSDKLNNVLDQLTVRTEQLENIYAQRDKLELEVRHKEEELHQTISEERKENQRIRRQHMDLENLHAELLRNFRELNDKMVQMRNNPDFKQKPKADQEIVAAPIGKRERKKNERGKPRLKMT